MKRIIGQAMGIAAQILIIGLCSGCGGGSIPSGGTGVFSPDKLPDQVISMNDLPPAVKPLAGAEVAGCKIKEVTKGVRSADGTYIYTITYSDQAGTLMEIKYEYDGTLISKAESQQSRTKPSTATE